MEDLKFQDIKNEQSRTYHFPTGKFTIEKARRLCVRPSGSHRIETEDGNKYIVPAGWLALEVTAKAWSL